MDNFTISKRVKIETLKILSNEQSRLFNNIEPIEFFDQLLDLRSLPSTDTRYSNARGDFHQHYINNDDWTLEEIFLEKFDFANSDENFIKLLNLIISPTINTNEDGIRYFYHTVNALIEQDNLEYTLISINNDGLPVYKIGEKNAKNRFKEIPDNKTPFFISHIQKNYEICFLLMPTTWDDYGNKNEFKLYYIKDQNKELLGSLKIITNENNSSTALLTGELTQLPDNYCSLGENFHYYENLKRISDKNFYSVLKALNDSAFFTQISEDFENAPNFKNSLIRYDTQERLLREARYRIDDYDLNNLYSFKYNFKPAFIEGEGTDIYFEFNNKEILPNRVYALIGKNGVGKTLLVSSLPTDISLRRKHLFTPKIPIFSKIIAVSYSAFDSFTIPDSSGTFNYIYCGLRSKDKPLGKEELLSRFYNSIKRIEENKRFESWIDILENFFKKEITDSWIMKGKYSFIPKLNIEKFNESQNKFSSGQAIFVFIFTEILANIRYDSLIIFDEPETHLHPNAIAQLVNSIHLLANKFQSFCIIATHSPLITQGILSKNVYIIDNESGVLSIRHPAIETFGENLTRITDEIFGARETPSHFRAELKYLVNMGYTYDQILELLQDDGTPLSLNASIFLKALVDSHD